MTCLYCFNSSFPSASSTNLRILSSFTLAPMVSELMEPNSVATLMIMQVGMVCSPTLGATASNAARQAVYIWMASATFGE